MLIFWVRVQCCGQREGDDGGPCTDTDRGRGNYKVRGSGLMEFRMAVQVWVCLDFFGGFLGIFFLCLFWV